MLNDFFSFRSMITPVLIRFAFVLGTALLTVGSLFFVGITGVGGLLGTALQTDAAAGGAAAGGGFVAFLAALVTAVVTAAVGLLTLRLYCEVTILFFRMNQTLNEINEKLTSKVQL